MGSQVPKKAKFSTSGVEGGFTVSEGRRVYATYICIAVFELLTAGACQSRRRDAQFKQHTVHTGVVQPLTGASLTSLFGDTEALCLLVVPQIAFSLSSHPVASGMTNKSRFT